MHTRTHARMHRHTDTHPAIVLRRAVVAQAIPRNQPQGCEQANPTEGLLEAERPTRALDTPTLVAHHVGQCEIISFSGRFLYSSVPSASQDSLDTVL